MRFRASLAFTVLLLLMLWAPFLWLFYSTLSEAALRQPTLWDEALPLRPLQRSLLWNSLTLALFSGVLSCILGVFPALAMARGPKIWRPVVALFTSLPLALPPTLMATAWLEISRTPPARSLAALAADKPLPVDGVFIAAPILALCFFPIAAFALAFALHSLPPHSEEAAHLFGNKKQAIRRFFWPLLNPAILGAMGVCGALAMWEMGACDLLDARTYSVEIYRAFNAGGEELVAALRSLPMLFIGALLLFPALRAVKFYGRQDSFARRDLTVTPAGTGGLVIALCLSNIAIGGPVYVFTKQLSNVAIFLAVWRDNFEELRNTLLLSSIAAPLITLLALFAVTFWRHWTPRAQKIALAFGVLPLLFPPITLGIALIGFYNRDGFSLIYGGVAPTGHAAIDWLTENCARYGLIIIGYIARFLPLALWILWEAARRVDEELIEAAQNMGATPSRATKAILWPLLWPALAGTLVLLWALCAGELTVSILVNQPGGQTLPKPIFNLMHIGESDAVAALSLTLVALTTLSFMIGALLFWGLRKIRR